MELSELIKKVQYRNEGFEKAFELLIELFKNRVFTVCYRMLNEYEGAKEISQDVFMEVYLKMGNLKNSGKFPTWLYRITINKCLNFIKKRNTSCSGKFDSFVSSENNSKIEKSDTINYLLKQLSTDYKTVLILFYIENKSIKEIAEILGISESAVKMRIKRAKENLKNIKET